MPDAPDDVADVESHLEYHAAIQVSILVSCVSGVDTYTTIYMTPPRTSNDPCAAGKCQPS